MTGLSVFVKPRCRCQGFHSNFSISPIPFPRLEQHRPGATLCDLVLPNIIAISNEGGSWSGEAIGESDPASYFYTGEPFTFADAPWELGDNMIGMIRVDNPLPPDTLIENLEVALLEYVFEDGVQVRSEENSHICTFSVTTNSDGDIVDWLLFLRESPFPGQGNPTFVMDSTQAFDQVGSALAGSTFCDQLAAGLRGVQ